jgi:hypothetical protein
MFLECARNSIGCFSSIELYDCKTVLVPVFNPTEKYKDGVMTMTDLLNLIIKEARSGLESEMVKFRLRQTCQFLYKDLFKTFYTEFASPHGFGFEAYWYCCSADDFLVP